MRASEGAAVGQSLGAARYFQSQQATSKVNRRNALSLVVPKLKIERKISLINLIVEFVGDDHVGVRIQECAEERGAATWITDEETKSLRVLKIEIHPKPFQQRR